MHKTHGIPTVDLKVQFLNAARIGDHLDKKLWVIKMGKSSLTCGFCFDHEDGRTCLSGEVTLVYVSLTADGIKASPFSEEMKSRISAFILNTESSR
jgi:4-hydroxybenzoyl-CoA thioesterase